MLWTITFHSGKLQMTTYQHYEAKHADVMCMHHLGMRCPISVALYLLALLVSSVNIAQFTPPPTYVKYLFHYFTMFIQFAF